MDFSYYQKINNAYGTTSKKEVELYQLKRSMNIDFDNNILAYPVKVDGIDRTVIITDSSKSNMKKLITKPEEFVSAGSLIQWKDDYWLVITDDPNNEVNSSVNIQKCVSSLKWLNKQGEVKEAYFTYRLDFYRGAGVDDGRVLTMPTERRFIYIQSNIDTQQIQKDQRFIFDRRVWRVMSIDGLFDGTITLTLDENLESNANDRMDLRIADYTNNIHTYSISILNGSAASINTGDTLQLIVDVNDDAVASSSPVTYTSSDVNIATVDASGLVTTILDGNVTITATITNHPTVNTSILLSVSTVAVDNFTVNIIGADECKVTQSQSYSATVYNGSEDNTKSVTWSLLGDDGVSSTALATITSQTGADCVVRANSVSPYQYGYVRLVATVVGNPTASQVKRIRIKSLF